MGVNEMGKLDGIPEEEDGGVVENLKKRSRGQSFDKEESTPKQGVEELPNPKFLLQF